MNKFDSEHKSSVNNQSPDQTAQCALSALPALLPTQDRLADVLLALAAKRESVALRPTKLQPRTAPRSFRTNLFVAVAAGFMISITALLLRAPQPSKVTVVHTTLSTPPTLTSPDANSEIAQLIAVSQHLEAGLRDLGAGSASFSQLYGRKQAELSLATLDTQLAEVMASNSAPAINQQRALWRERVAVLSAVENGDYRQALFVVD